MTKRLLPLLLISCSALVHAAEKIVPEKVVVLTFDDGCLSHTEFVAPLLKKHGFGGTFYITEGFDFTTNKKFYMTWEQIKGLHDDGFEIGNHTQSHMMLAKRSAEVIEQQVTHIEKRCAAHGIPKPVTFCYPNYFSKNVEGLAVLKKMGYRYARTGGAEGYDPKSHHPLQVPQAGDFKKAGTFEQFVASASMAKDGRIAVMTFHGVPDLGHPQVSTTQELFKRMMQYLADNDYTVIAMRDLDRYVGKQ